MPVPADRRYSKTHEWFKLDGEAVTIGLTQFAVDELTDITFVDLPKNGAAVEAGKGFGEVESVKATSELYSAVEGVVVDVNARLADEPGLLNTDPFGAGWLVKVRCKSTAPLETLLDGPSYDRMTAGG